MSNKSRNILVFHQSQSGNTNHVIFENLVVRQANNLFLDGIYFILPGCDATPPCASSTSPSSSFPQSPQVLLTIFRYLFVLLGDETRCKSELSYPSTPHNNCGWGLNPDISILSIMHLPFGRRALHAVIKNSQN